MKRVSEKNLLLKQVAESEKLSLATVKRIDRLVNQNLGNMTDLMNKAKANSQRRIYSYDLTIPNNAMLLQLLEHSWSKHEENRKGDYNLRYIQLKKDCFNESLQVLSSGASGDDSGKVFFAGLSVEDLYFISGIFTLIQKGAYDEKPFGVLQEKNFIINAKQLYRVLYPGSRYDRQGEAHKKHFMDVITALFLKTSSIQAEYCLSQNRLINSIDINIRETWSNNIAKDEPTEDSIGLIFKRATIINDDAIHVQLNPNGLLQQSKNQNRLVTISKDWLKYGMSAGNHDLTKFFIAYRIKLSANSNNHMKTEITVSHMDKQIGKTDKGFVKKYLQYLKEIRLLKDFTVSRAKVTWTMQPAEKFFGKDKKIDLIQVKDEHKELIQLPQPAEIKALEKRLSAINGFHAKHKVTLGKYRTLDTRLHAVFSRGSYDKGGRFYTDGDNSYQGLKSEEREKILIDGKRTVELDFSAYHPHLLYASKGIQANADPYGFHPCRKAAKLAFNIMLNAKDQKSAIGAFKRAWSEAGESETISPVGIFNLCRNAHKAINDSFCSDSGIKLQNIDSKIALEVVEAMQNKKIVCLPMHDSFIVTSNHADELKQTMQEIYHKHTGFDCPIK